jgi:hypothetical protein
MQSAEMTENAIDTPTDVQPPADNPAPTGRAGWSGLIRTMTADDGGKRTIVSLEAGFAGDAASIEAFMRQVDADADRAANTATTKVHAAVDAATGEMVGRLHDLKKQLADTRLDRERFKAEHTAATRRMERALVKGQPVDEHEQAAQEADAAGRSHDRREAALVAAIRGLEAEIEQAQKAARLEHAKPIKAELRAQLRAARDQLAEAVRGALPAIRAAQGGLMALRHADYGGTD